MIEPTTQILFKDVLSISKKYDKIAEQNGENFNVFTLLKVEKDEVKTHSMFIAELLNPKGCHGQKELFLMLFLSVLKNRCGLEIDIDVSSIFIVIEKYIGRTNENKTEGGRIDIIISDKLNRRVIIENKIYAPEQKNQLSRYYNFDKAATIIYLTLSGEVPKTFGEGLVLNQNLFLLSYKVAIIEWLEMCKEEVSKLAFLREIISQYIFLLKGLTNQTKHREMSNEITNLITNNSENFEASMLIANEFESIKSNVLESFWKDVQKDLEEVKRFNLKGKVWITKRFDQICPALFIKTDRENSFIGLEPLNGQHYKSGFSELFIGTYEKNDLTKDYTGPFNEWHNCKKTGLHFGDIKETLKEILPNSQTRNEIKDKIIKMIINYINECGMISNS